MFVVCIVCFVAFDFFFWGGACLIVVFCLVFDCGSYLLLCLFVFAFSFVLFLCVVYSLFVFFCFLCVLCLFVSLVRLVVLVGVCMLCCVVVFALCAFS